MEILLTPNPDRTYKVDMDEVSYDVRIRYLQRKMNTYSDNIIKSADEFMIEIALSGGTPFIKTSLKTNRDILLPYKYRPNCPQGKLVIRDYLADTTFLQGGLYIPERVKYDGLGTRFILLYSSQN